MLTYSSTSAPDSGREWFRILLFATSSKISEPKNKTMKTDVGEYSYNQSQLSVWPPTGKNTQTNRHTDETELSTANWINSQQGG